MPSDLAQLIFPSLEAFQIEIPSWGFSNTGTRFGKFIQPGAATTIEEKFSDSGFVHSLTGICPTLALHVSWDFLKGLASVGEVKSWQISMASDLERSTQICSRIRSTNLVRLEIPTSPFVAKR